MAPLSPFETVEVHGLTFQVGQTPSEQPPVRNALCKFWQLSKVPNGFQAQGPIGRKELQGLMVIYPRLYQLGETSRARVQKWCDHNQALLASWGIADADFFRTQAQDAQDKIEPRKCGLVLEEHNQNCEHAVDGDAVLEDGRRSTGLNRPGVNSSRYKGNRFADHDDSRHYGNGSEKRPLPSTPSPKRPSIPLDTPASGTIRPTSASPATLAPTTATVLLPPPPPPAFRAPRRLVTAEPRAQLPEADVAWLVDGLGGVCDLLGRVLAPEDDAGGGLAVLGARELRACQGFVGAALRELRGYLVQFPGGGVRLRRGWQRERADQREGNRKKKEEEKQ
ncbi:hypothetical protein P8C59_004528 [Phyllachora maydis]|uniref:Uncharacterized protein n=1 Tax=Phyllachora maydis TaxID=1825666 RepID=A0AAD9MCJ3_9PEZI|nr:hypothetical protein P8C59_004528 [Phyllachora maydis]